MGNSLASSYHEILIQKFAFLVSAFDANYAVMDVTLSCEESGYLASLLL